MSLKFIGSILLIVLVVSSSAFCQVDSGLVKIRVNIDSVKIVFDNVTITTDQLGNPLVINSWLIFNATIGEHRVQFTRESYDPIDTTIIVDSASVVSLDIKFPDKTLEIDETSQEKIKFVITSEPDSCYIIVNNDSLNIMTPATLNLDQGTTIIKLSRQGYQSLAKTVETLVNQEIHANFILKTAEPIPLTLDSLGLAYAEQKPLRNILEAQRIKNKYQTMTEMFAVIPLSQGILAKLIINDDQDKEANILITVGAVLTLGTFVLSKVLYKRKFNQIIEDNEMITNDNLFADQSNAELDITLNEKNQKLFLKWRRANSNKGRVVINIIESQ